MRRFLTVYTMAWIGALAGAALGTPLLRPAPTPGQFQCGMWALPGMFLGGAAGAALATWLGLRLTRRPGGRPAGQREQSTAEPF